MAFDNYRRNPKAVYRRNSRKNFRINNLEFSEELVIKLPERGDMLKKFPKKLLEKLVKKLPKESQKKS